MIAKVPIAVCAVQRYFLRSKSRVDRELAETDRRNTTVAADVRPLVRTAGNMRHCRTNRANCGIYQVEKPRKRR